MWRRPLATTSLCSGGFYQSQIMPQAAPNFGSSGPRWQIKVIFAGRLLYTGVLLTYRCNDIWDEARCVIER